MSERKEKLSAFIDDALHHDEVMSFSLSAEAEDADVIQRYQMVGEALRGEVSESSFVDVSAAVREALADENIADQMPAGDVAASSPLSQPSSGSLFGSTLFGSWLRPIGGFGVAAAVAVVMVSTLSQPESDTDGTNPLGSTMAQDTDAVPAETVVRAKNSPQQITTVPVSSQNIAPAELNTHPAVDQDQVPRTRAATYDNQTSGDSQNQSVHPGVLIDNQ
mgnify:CR=1 FL=1